MSKLEEFVTRHPAPAYFGLTFAISWGLALLAIGGAGGMRGTSPTSDPRFAFALLGMLAGPSLAGLLLTGLLRGRKGLRELLSRLLLWRVSLGWYAVALFTAPVLMTASLLLLSRASPVFRPGILASDHKMSLLLVSLGVALLAGIFEEVGWTGFAIPTLRRRHGLLATGLMVGVWWTAWHLLPNLWSSQAASGDLAMPVYLAGTALGVFVGYLTAFRVLMVWVYEHTGSLLLGILMHVSITASVLALSPLDLSGGNLQAHSFAFAGAVWVAVAVVVIAQLRRLSQGSLRTRTA